VGTRHQQQVRILKTLEQNGWRREAVEHPNSDWIFELWTLRSSDPPIGVQAWMAFVVDQEWRGKRAPGEGVCALVADTVRRSERKGWLAEIPLGRRWERSIQEFFDVLNAARATKVPSGRQPAKAKVPVPRPGVKEKWKHLR
jgi:hypothetical protein